MPSLTVFFLYMLLLFLPGSAMAETYYVSNTGDDANDGLTETTPWQTITKVNADVPPNAIVHFRRGDTFRGKIELAGTKTGVTFSAYGTGENPVVSGSLEISGWTKYNEDIWVSDISSLPDIPEEGIHHLFADRELMRIARYPNTGWLRVGETDPEDKQRFKDPVLAEYQKDDDYWNGATLRIRSWSWLFETAKVKDYIASEGEIFLERPITCAGQPFLPLWGYYLDNVFEELDAPGEWYFDADNHKVYLWAPDNADPNSMLVEGSVYDIGINIYLREHQTTIENLTFRHQTQSGVVVNNSDSVTIQHNKFEYCEEQGINIWNDKDLTISDNTFDNMLNLAIYSKSGGLSATGPVPFDPGNSVIEKNIIRNTGMIAGYGKSKGGNITAIKLESKGTGVFVRKNTIEHTGSSGIRVAGGGHFIENNVVRRSLLLLDDGGAIQVNSSNNVIKGNFISESFGNRDESSGYSSFKDGEGSYFRIMGMGIGSGRGYEGNIIEENTISDNRDWGIRLNQWRNTIIRNNVLFNNGKQAVFEGDKNDPKIVYNNVFEGNVVYSLSSEQDGLFLYGPYDYGTFKENYYCNPYSEIVIHRDGRKYSLAEWKKTFPSYDSNSKTGLVRFDEYRVSDYGPNLIINSGFTSDIDDWSENGYIISHDPDNAEMDEGSIKVVYEEDGPQLRPNIFEVAEGQYYLLRFSVIANAPGTVRVTFSDQTPEPWKLIRERYFAVDETRKEYTFVFNSHVATPETRPRFSTQAYVPDVYWLDNVVFHSVEAELNNPRDHSALFINPEEKPKNIDLENTVYQDLDGNTVLGSITLDPYSSKILTYKESTALDTPIITGFDPISGEPGDEISLIGTNFTDAASVRFDGIDAADYIVVSDEEIIVTVPKEAATGQISVFTPEGNADSPSDFILKIPPGSPTIMKIDPVSGFPGEQIIITGTNFAGIISVKFSGIDTALFTIHSGTELAAIVPEGAITGQISVITPEGTASSTSDFAVEVLPVAGDYHLSSGEGEDANDGASPETPWKTLGRLNQALRNKVIHPGDKILFKRGDVFFGRIYSSQVKGRPGNPVVYSDYGNPSDPEPVIKGYVEIIGWRNTSVNGVNACEADVSGLMENTAEKETFDIEKMIAGKYQVYPQYFFLNGQAQTLARHPNQGFFFIDEVPELGSAAIHDAELEKLPNAGDWKGGQVVVRMDSRTYTNFEIESVESGILAVAGGEEIIGEHGMPTNNGYFLQRKQQGLDAGGEWFFDEPGKRLCFIPPAGMTCDELDNRVSVSVFENAIDLSDHITIENIQFEGYGGNVFEVTSPTEYGVIDNCTVLNSYQGISGESIQDSILSNNTFRDIFSEGIGFWGNISHLTISGNTFENIGLYPGTEGEHSAISLGSDEPETCISNIVSKNYINTVGYAGIVLRFGDPSGDSPTIVEKNVIRHALGTLADGGSIIMQGARGNIIRDNILADAVGNKESWNAGIGDAEYTAHAFGIAEHGTDMRSNQYIHNTVINHDEGFHGGKGTRHTVLKDNVFYGNRVYQAKLSMGDQAEGSLNNEVQNNVFYCTDPFQWVMRQDSGEDHYNWNFGYFENNYYCNPYSTNRYAGAYIQNAEYSGALIWRWQKDTPYNYFLNLHEYQKISGGDVNSETDSEKWTVFRIEDKLYEADEILSGNYISNSNFESGSEPWEVTGGEISPDIREELDGNCLRVTAGDGHYVQLNNGKPISFERDAYYLLSFSTFGEKPLYAGLSPGRWDEVSGNQIIMGNEHKFSVGQGRYDYSYIFKIRDAGTEAGVLEDFSEYDMRIFFDSGKDDPAYWLDNVRLYKVSLREAIPPEEHSKIFVNDSDADKTFLFNGMKYKDLDGNLIIEESITLHPYHSKVLIFESGPVTRQLSDAIRILQMLSGLDPDGIYWISDVNGDARMGLAEVVFILQELAVSEW